MSIRTTLSLYAILCVFAVSPATAALTLTKQVSPSLGTIYSGSTGRRFVLDTNGNITGSGASDYVGGAAAAVFQVGDDSSPSGITILADNITPTGGITVNKVLCSYNGGTQQKCSGTGMDATSISTATLRVGIDVTTSTAHTSGAAVSISLDISIAYQ